jgi:hypothetical protein
MFKKINFNNVLFFILIILIIFGTYKLIKHKFKIQEGFTGNELQSQANSLSEQFKGDAGKKFKNKSDKVASKNIKNLIKICNIKIRGLIVSLTAKNVKYQKVQIKDWTETKELLEKFQNSTSSMSSGVSDGMSGVASYIIGKTGNGTGEEKEDETDEKDETAEEDEESWLPF